MMNRGLCTRSTVQGFTKDKYLNDIMPQLGQPALNL